MGDAARGGGHATETDVEGNSLHVQGGARGDRLKLSGELCLNEHVEEHQTLRPFASLVEDGEDLDRVGRLVTVHLVGLDIPLIGLGDLIYLRGAILYQNRAEDEVGRIELLAVGLKQGLQTAGLLVEVGEETSEPT